MRRTLLTILTTMAWLLASPSLQLRDSGWVEVGAAPAAAQEVRKESQDIKPPAKTNKKKSAKSKSNARVGSTGVVRSNQPGFYPAQPIVPPQSPNVTGTVTRAPDVAGYPNVPAVPIVPRGATGGAGVETSQDRVTRCTHQGVLGGLPAGQQGTYIHNCAF